MEIQILDFPVANPGKCYYCGGVDKEQYLDTGIQIEFYGALYICNECFRAIANKMNYISPLQHVDLQDKVESLTQDREALEFKLMALEQALNSLKAAGFHDPDSDSVSNNKLVHPSNRVSDPALPFESVSEGEGNVESEGDGTSESLDESGLADILDSVSSDDEPFSFKY